MGEKSVFEAYLVAVTPIGLFGGLHFYLNRPHIGLLYMCTVGVFGIGYIVDMFRVPILVKEANIRRQHKKDPTIDLPPDKNVIDAYLMWFPLGIIGLHHVYLKNGSWALLYFLTVGLFGVGWLVDAFWMVSMVRQLNARLTDPAEKRRKLVKKAAREKEERMRNDSPAELDPGDIITNKDSKSIAGGETVRSTPRHDKMEGDVPIDEQDGQKKKRDKETRAALALGLSPLGILGAHHLYLRRSPWALLYLVSGGLAGIGWILDWFRLVLLVRRCNAVARGDADRKQKTVDDAYVLWFPWGLLGAHQFYLGRHGWGFIYLATVGMFGFGWLSDVVRIPQLVRESNQRRIDHQKDPEIDTNITPPRDDYDTSLTLNLGVDENVEHDGLDTKRSRVSGQVKDTEVGTIGMVDG